MSTEQDRATVAGLMNLVLTVREQEFRHDLDGAAETASAIEAYAERLAQVQQVPQWMPYGPTNESLPEPCTEVLLWTLEDFWDDEGAHVVRSAVHMGEVREYEGSRYLSDYMNTDHSAITHWMPLPAAPASPGEAAQTNEQRESTR
jgi:hypothetical protein